MKFSLIIPNYNGKNLLKTNLPFIESTIKLSNQDCDCEIIIVDDASSDGSVSYLQENYPQIKLKVFLKNQGFASACNEGARIAQGEILVFLNNDLEVTPSFLKEIIAVMPEDFFALSPKILVLEENLNESVYELFFSGYFQTRKVDDYILENCKTLYPIPFACGAALVCPKNKFFTLGGFDELFSPYYWEDVDLSYRAWKLGWKVYYQGQSLVYHKRGATIGDGSKDLKVDRIFLRNMLLFTWKNLHSFPLFLAHLFNLFWDLIFALIGRRWNFIRAFYLALGKLPEVIQKRKKAGRQALISDLKVLAEFKKNIKNLKLKSLKRFLIIHLHGGIGDLLLSTPLISTLRKNFPDSFIAFMLKDEHKEILENNPYLDELILVKNKDFNLKGFVKLLKIIRDKKFDLSIVLWSALKEAYLCYLAGIKERVGQSRRLLYSFIYNHQVKIRSEFNDKESHWVEIFLDYLRILNINNLIKELYFTIPKNIQERANMMLKQNNIMENDLVIGIHLGKGIPLNPKIWPVKIFSKIGDILQEKFKAKIIFTGSEKEIPLIKEAQKYMKFPSINLAGTTSLNELGGIISRCKLFICPDSGPMHIAAALKVPSIAIFALKSDFPKRWHPYNTIHKIIIPKNNPCRKKCIKEKCAYFICLESIDSEEVIKAASELLAEKK